VTVFAFFFVPEHWSFKLADQEFAIPPRGGGNFKESPLNLST
jgi:hypothetical protein